jgi:eukaryotic translation initiation factor 2C
VKVDPVMFMGADVTNFGLGVDRNSVAAVVGSYDLQFTKYAVRLSEQRNANDNRQSQEIILDLEEMATALIMTFRAKTGATPKRIVFYRDGLDSGQFQRVLENEVIALRNACTKLNFTPKITMVIVQKRHHTRLFPISSCDKAGRNENVPAGTVVSSVITNKNQFDFYLCSHEAIQVGFFLKEKQPLMSPFIFLFFFSRITSMSCKLC